MNDTRGTSWGRAFIAASKWYPFLCFCSALLDLFWLLPWQKPLSTRQAFPCFRTLFRDSRIHLIWRSLLPWLTKSPLLSRLRLIPPFLPTFEGSSAPGNSCWGGGRSSNFFAVAIFLGHIWHYPDVITLSLVLLVVYYICKLANWRPTLSENHFLFLPARSIRSTCP